LITQGAYNSTTWSAHARAWFDQKLPSGTGTSYTWGTWPAVLGGCSSQLLVGIRDNDNPAFIPPTVCATNTYSDLVVPTPGKTAFWKTPYDNPEATVTPNNTNKKLLPQVDHVVALKDAWSDGASTWTQQLRYDFANDWRSVQLITVSATTNGSKMDNSIESWQPPNTAYLCAYAEMMVAIKYQWNLQIDNTPNTGAGLGAGYSEVGFLSAVLNDTIPTGGCAA
jgi:hypothetical protein